MARSAATLPIALALIISATAGAGELISADFNSGEGLIAWYPFDEGVVDKTGNIEPIEGASILPILKGKFGGAVKLDGDTFVALPVDLGPDVVPSMTISIWVKTDPRPTDAELEKSLANSAYVVSESIAVGNLKNDSPYFYGEALGRAIVGPKHSARRGQWQHVAVVRTIEDRPNAEGEIGPYVVSQFYSGGRMSELVVPFRGQGMATDLYLGTNSPRHPPRLRFRGAVDELRIYDRALSQDEIGLLAKAKASPSRTADSVSESEDAGLPDNAGTTDTSALGNVNVGESSGPTGAGAPSTVAIIPETSPIMLPADAGLPGTAGTTDTSVLGNVNLGGLSAGDLAVDNPTDDNRHAATPVSTLPAAGGSPTVMPSNENLDDFQDRVDDPEFQDGLRAVDWNVKGMIPLTQEEKANIYPGSTVTVKIRVDKDDPANKIPDVKLAIKGAQSSAKSVPLRVITSEQMPTARRDIPMTLTIPSDFVFEQEGQIGTFSATTWLLAADGMPLQDTVTNNNRRQLSIPVRRLAIARNCGNTTSDGDGARTATACLEGSGPLAEGRVYIDHSVLFYSDIPFSTRYLTDDEESTLSEQILIFENGEPLDEIRLEERNDKPCRGLVTGIYGSRLEFDHCVDTPGITLAENGLWVRSRGALVTGLKVCRNAANNRLKGVEIEHREVRDDGTLSPGANLDIDDLPNCVDWVPATIRRCNAGSAAAGIRLLISQGTALSGGHFVHSIDLACGQVKLREDT